MSPDPAVLRPLPVAELARRIGAVLHAPAGDGARRIGRVYAGDRMSDLISRAGADTLLVTNLDGAQLLRAASLMDAPAICLVEGVAPRPETLAEAVEQGTALLVSPVGVFETCGLLYRALCGGEGERT